MKTKINLIPKEIPSPTKPRILQRPILISSFENKKGSDKNSSPEGMTLPPEFLIFFILRLS